MSAFKAESIIRGSMDAATLSLAGLRLSSLDALVPLLAQMPQLRHLDVSHNELHELPVDLSALTELEALDLSGNPIGGVHYILDGLQSLPRLTSLKVSLPPPVVEAEEQLILRLPALTAFNGVALTGPADDGDELSTSALRTASAGAAAAPPVDAAFWREADSAGVEALFADVSKPDVSSTQEFFDYMGRVVQHVTCLTAAEEDPFAQEGEVLKARRLLYEFCFGDVVRSTFKDGNDALGRQLQALLRYESALMDQYDAHWRRILRDRDGRMAHMRRDMQDAMTDIRSLLQHLPATDAMRQAQQSQPPPSPSAAPAAVSQERRRGGEGAGAAAAAVANSSASLNATPLARPGNATHLDVSGLGTSTGASPQPLPPPGFTRRSQRPPAEVKAAAAARKSGFKKLLSLRQLKELIEGIYTSKAKYDDKCKQSGLPRETMEQHMYTYLNQRYGLRDIILEWATAIVEAVRRYAPEDNDVAVFGKILRNEVDEEFRFVQQHVRETVKELLRMHIKAKRPLIGVVELNGALQQAMTGTVAEDAWKEVVKYMYNAGDAALVTSIIHQYLLRQSLPRVQRHRKEEVKLSPTAVYSQLHYRDFVRLLLDFQLDGHERFLERYVQIFRRHDRDRNGIVNGAEFAAMVRELDPSKPEEAIAAMVAQVDPLDSQLITFSESIAFLNDELLKLSYSQHEAQA